MYKVLIVDDQVILRQLLDCILAKSDQFEIAASIENASLAESYCTDGNVDLILMDAVMNDGSNGLETAKALKASFPKIKIIIMTSKPDSLILGRARETGVESFWYKEVQEIPILEVMKRTMLGENIWPANPPVVKLGLAKSTDFTAREIDVLRSLAEGLTDKDIAERLHMSLNTVRYHVGNLISKTGKSSRTELAVSAVQSGVTIPGIR